MNLLKKKNKKLKYYKYYETFDHEYGGRTRLYGIEKIETNHLFKHEKENIFKEMIFFMDSEKKNKY